MQRVYENLYCDSVCHLPTSQIKINRVIFQYFPNFRRFSKSTSFPCFVSVLHVEYLHEPLENYLRKFPKVKVIRTKKREGLIRARLIGKQFRIKLSFTNSINVNGYSFFLNFTTECTSSIIEDNHTKYFLTQYKIGCNS